MRLSILFVLVTSFTLLGCNSKKADQETAAATNAEGKKPRIALVMKSLANEFFSTMADGAKKYQAEHSSKFDLVVNGIKDERDISRQVSIVEEMVASKVDAIVIAPADSKALIPALRRAQQAGVVVINIDNRLDQEILQAESIQIPFVGPDNKKGAKEVGAYLASKLKEGDKVAILEGVLTSFNGQQRSAGFVEAANEAKLEIVNQQSADWEMNKANTIASSMLSEHPGIKAIFAANDSMAMGAMAATKAANRPDVLIAGFDNIAAVQSAIREGKILATADQHGDQLAVYGIQNALKLIEDSSTQIADVETPVDLITLETLQ